MNTLRHENLHCTCFFLNSSIGTTRRYIFFKYLHKISTTQHRRPFSSSKSLPKHVVPKYYRRNIFLSCSWGFSGLYLSFLLTIEDYFFLPLFLSFLFFFLLLFFSIVLWYTIR
ncbi:hypothetical protein BDF21DRAFT_406179 [Thamnidium elegans]|nr:hypothetical protein BDF21DRAFT_406179 [Thamnidium elegans]